MKKITFLALISLIAAGSLIHTASAEQYWEQSFSQSGTESWLSGANPADPIGDFDGIQVIWDSGSKFTTLPLALSGFTSGVWTVNQTGDISAFAQRSGTTNYSDFFINFKYDANPLVTSFYYGVFRGDSLIQSQHFTYDGAQWLTDSVNSTTFQTKAANVVPEPISSALFLLGGAVLGIKKLRKKK